MLWSEIEKQLKVLKGGFAFPGYSIQTAFKAPQILETEPDLQLAGQGGSSGVEQCNEINPERRKVDEGLVFWCVGAAAVGAVKHIGKSCEVEYY